MKGDFTRSTFRREKHYSCVRMQQGRVQLDADWNEQADITRYRAERETADVVGCCGVPAVVGGFKVDVVLGIDDLIVSPGRIYVDGIMCELESPSAVIEGFPAGNKIVVSTLLPEGFEFKVGQLVEISGMDDQEFRKTKWTRINCT